MTEVELSALIEKRFINVGLNKIGSKAAVWIDLSLFDLLFDHLQGITIFYIFSSVAQLSRFDDPPAEAFFVEFIVFSQKGQILFVLYSSSDVKS